MGCYLVTGAGGFLGGHMAQRLAKAGHEVFCPCRHRPAPSAPGIRSFAGSLDDVAHWAAQLPTVLDGVLHFAALLPPQGSAPDYMRTNATGTANLLELCKKKGNPRCSMASTLYLAGSHIPIVDDAPLAVTHPYYISKFAAERLCAAYAQETGAAHVIFRISSPYGRGMSPQSIVYLFIQQAVTEKRLCVFNSGSKVQNFIYYKDIINAFELALCKGSGVYNLCSTQSTSIKDAAFVVSQLLGDIPVAFKHRNENDDNVRWMPLVDKIGRELGFAERYGVESGFRETIEWFKNKDRDNCHGLLV